VSVPASEDAACWRPGSTASSTIGPSPRRTWSTSGRSPTSRPPRPDLSGLLTDRASRAVDAVLADQAIRRRTEQLAETMRGYRGAAGTVEALEALVDAGV
jgi:hypothetical protein